MEETSLDHNNITPSSSSSNQHINHTNNQLSNQIAPNNQSNISQSTELTQHISDQPSVHQQSQQDHTTTSQTTDDKWWIKKILWPPFPTQNNSSPRSVSILMQNSNGPCSLLAICNILLLRGSITLPDPINRTSISFATLAAVLQNYLLQKNLEPEQLNRALGIIPSTRIGLDLNPSFASIDGFRPTGSHSCTPALDLFKAAGIQLLHGWVADSQDLSTWNVVVEQCGDYDKTVELIATGDALMSKQSDPLIQLTPQEESLIKDSLVARQFLETTSTQLSYAGLFQLSTGIDYDSTAVFLRNSHLSVLYHRPYFPKATPISTPPPLPPPPDLTDPDYDHQTALEVHAVSQQLQKDDLATCGSELEDSSNLPKLFTLVTDLSLLNQPEIVWESLEDVEGGLSEFYDWKLSKSCIKNPSYNSHLITDQSTALSGISSNSVHQVVDPNADFDLAHRLQEEEYKQASMREEASRRRAMAEEERMEARIGGRLIQEEHGHRQSTSDHSRVVSSSIIQPHASGTTHHPSSSLYQQGPHPHIIKALSPKKKHKDCVIV